MGRLTDAHPEHAELRADRIYLGWQYLLLHPDPGPPRNARRATRRTTPGSRSRTLTGRTSTGRPLEPAGQVAPQRRRRARCRGRPARLRRGDRVAVRGHGRAGRRRSRRGVLLRDQPGQPGRAVPGPGRLAAARRRSRAKREHENIRLQEEHAERYREWAERKAVYDKQISWYAVAVPDEIDRIDVAGDPPRLVGPAHPDRRHPLSTAAAHLHRARPVRGRDRRGPDRAGPARRRRPPRLGAPLDLPKLDLGRR